MAKAVAVNFEGAEKAEQTLMKFALDLRERKLKSAVLRASNVVKKEAKRLAPKPGYPGDKPGLTPLNQTIAAKVISHRSGITQGMIGPRRPDGAHGHLVEFGHVKVLWGLRVGGRVPPHPFMRPAADTTQPQQQSAIINYLKQELKKVKP